MDIREHVPLAGLTTFRIGGDARYLIDVSSPEALREALAFARDRGLPTLVMGGGSNVLASDDGFKGAVVRMRILGVSTEDLGDTVVVRAGAGEEWDKLVAFCVSRGLWGIENLSGIPGTVGAAPMQNIGAYGTELKDTLVSVDAYDRATDSVETLSAESLALGYRTSAFKEASRNKYVILSVALRLRKDGIPGISYKDLAAHFGEHVPTLAEIRRAVLAIRARKFPDLTKEGTAGSFFKNPLVAADVAEKLKERYPDMPQYREGNLVKIPLAWILDRILKLKGESRGRVRAYEAQPLVIVAKGGARAGEVRAFARDIATRVKDATGITIEPEVCIMDRDALLHRI